MMSLEKSRFGKRVKGPVLDIPAASRMLTLAEDTEARRKGSTVEEARKSFARVLKVPEKTLLHIRNQRRKGIPSFLMNGIRDVLIGVLQSEIAKLENEIAIAQQVGLSHREDAFEQAAASIAAARRILQSATGKG